MSREDKAGGNKEKVRRRREGEGGEDLCNELADGSNAEVRSLGIVLMLSDDGCHLERRKRVKRGKMGTVLEKSSYPGPKQFSLESK